MVLPFVRFGSLVVKPVCSGLSDLILTLSRRSVLGSWFSVLGSRNP